MIKEVIVVEGNSDVAAVKRALDADCLVTGGYSKLRSHKAQLDAAYSTRGLIIFTDPDSAGARIRAWLKVRYPNAKHAYLAKRDAQSQDDIGVECATSAAIVQAICNVRPERMQPQQVFSNTDIVENNLSGSIDASTRRARLCEILGLGVCNAKQLLQRLNSYEIARQEFFAALAQLDKEQYE